MKYNEGDAEFLQRLRSELVIWLDKGLISDGQKDKILSYYGAFEEAHAKAGSGKLITVISVLGSILVGLGIILFVASNWHEIPRWGKLILLFSAMLLSYGIGYYLRYARGNYPKAGGALIFLGTMAYGANIYLIAQIYNISVHYPNGELLWVLGTLPLAYIIGSRPILSLALVNLLIWLGMEAGFRIRVEGSYETFHFYFPLYFMAGLTLWVTGMLHDSRERLKGQSGPHMVLGIFLTMLSWYIFTFDAMFRTTLGTASLIIFYSSLAAVFVVMVLSYLFFSKDKKKWWTFELGVLFFIMIALMLLTYHNPGAREYLRNAVSQQYETNEYVVSIMTLISNILFAGAIIGLIFVGFARKSIIYINFGLLFFVLDVTARYFDFFWKMLPRSLFFIIGGLLLMGGGFFLERKRKRILSSFNMKEAA